MTQPSYGLARKGKSPVPFTSEDLAQLGTFITSEVGKAVETVKAELNREKSPEETAQERTAVVGIPDVPPDAGPLFWVHLANGDIITTHDSQSTHMDVNGVTVPVIGRYEQPEGATA